MIYRIHDTPSQEKVGNLIDFLATLDIPWTKGEAPSTARFNKLLEQTRDGPHAEIVNEVVLRSQMQAVYSPDNIGHYGLNLARYAHFTSPIRRYADLIVHRALIRALSLGDDGLSDLDIAELGDTAEHITMAERRAMAAERDATGPLRGRLPGRLGGGRVRRADHRRHPLRPVRALAGPALTVWCRSPAWAASTSSTTSAATPWSASAPWPALAAEREVDVRLREATPITGGLLFEMLSEPEPADKNAPRPRQRQAPRGRRPGGPPRKRR